MARLSSADLAAVQVTDEDRAEVATGASPPRSRRGRMGGPGPSRWLTIVKMADDLAAQGTEPEKIDGVMVQVGEWVQYPKDNEPIVWNQNIRAVRKAFGRDSEYSAGHGGDYFEITLRDTIRVSDNTRGVLWVRKVIVPKEAGE